MSAQSSESPNAGAVSSPFGSQIIGTGSAFPHRRLTNDALTARIETTSQWIEDRTGIRERYISEPGRETEFNSALGARAALLALEMAGRTPLDVDQIIYATCTPDTLIPATACWLQKRIGASRAWAMDINAACSGFVFGLATADQFIRSGNVKTALVVGADKLSAFTNWSDRSSCILFGDGAGAAVVERTAADSPRRILTFHLTANGELYDLFHIETGGSNRETTPEAFAHNLHKMQMRGREIFKQAVQSLVDYATLALEANHYSIEDLDWFVPHQANLRIIEAVAKRLGVPLQRVVINIERYGNTSSATAPSALDEAVRDGRIKPGDLILMDVFGAGLTCGSLLMRW